MRVHPVDYLVHFSSVLILVSYSVRDIVWLRRFAVAATLTNIPYFLLQQNKLWPPVIWALAFTTVNLYQLPRIYLERRPVVLSEDEQKLDHMGFGSLQPREFLSLLLAGELKNAATGDAVLTQGKPVSSICMAISGTLRALKNGKDVMPLKLGYLIGRGLALTGQPSPMAAAFVEPSRYFCWRLGNIRGFWTSGQISGSPLKAR